MTEVQTLATTIRHGTCEKSMTPAATKPIMGGKFYGLTPVISTSDVLVSETAACRILTLYRAH